MWEDVTSTWSGSLIPLSFDVVCSGAIDSPVSPSLDACVSPPTSASSAFFFTTSGLFSAAGSSEGEPSTTSELSLLLVGGTSELSTVSGESLPSSSCELLVSFVTSCEVSASFFSTFPDASSLLSSDFPSGTSSASASFADESFASLMCSKSACL